MPIIFILSAVVSGVAALTLIYVVSSKMRKAPIDENCVKGLARVLWAFLIVTLVIEALEYAEMLYRRIEGVDMVKHLIAGPISVGLAIQVAFSAIPLVILTVLLARKVRGRALVGWMSFSAVLLMSAVLAMRWNVVIGGQELSKTAKGLITYTPPVWGREGVVWALSLLSGTFALLWAMTRLLPPWEPVRMSE
jgi:formate-dependent nitrite reductase membrane component NrfD